MNYIKILIESVTNLRMTYKNRDQIGRLLKILLTWFFRFDYFSDRFLVFFFFFKLVIYITFCLHQYEKKVKFKRSHT